MFKPACYCMPPAPSTSILHHVNQSAGARVGGGGSGTEPSLPSPWRRRGGEGEAEQGMMASSKTSICHLCVSHPVADRAGAFCLYPSLLGLLTAFNLIPLLGGGSITCGRAGGQGLLWQKGLWVDTAHGPCGWLSGSMLPSPHAGALHLRPLWRRWRALCPRPLLMTKWQLGRCFPGAALSAHPPSAWLWAAQGHSAVTHLAPGSGQSHWYGELSRCKEPQASAAHPSCSPCTPSPP